MSEDSIQQVTKDGLRYLKNVFEYRSRTVAILFVKNTDELLATWENGQFELSAKYQYQGENAKIWDYYLAICCDFDEASLANDVRFQIENDRFCCRKIFIFNCTLKNFSEERIVQKLFPKIHSPERIEILEPAKFIPSLGASASVTKDFFVRQLEDNEIENLASILIAESSAND